jgi:TolA-binding protein
MAKEEEAPADGLFDVGEFYLKNKRFSQAKYVFSRYLIYYPSGKNAFQAAKNIEIAENALSRYGDGKGPGVAVSTGGSQPASAPTSTIENPSKIFGDAIVLISQGKYQEAFMSFKLIVDSGADAEWTAKSSYEIGRCMFMLNKFDDSLKYLTNMLTKYPKHPNLLDAMFVIGQCHEKTGRKDQAAAFYKKIITMGGSHDGTAEKAKRALTALGA